MPPTRQERRRQQRLAGKAGRSTPGTPVADPNPAFGEALELYQAGALAGADALCRRILRAAPEHLGTVQLAGVIAGQTGKGQRAIRLMRKAAELDPANPAAHNNLGNALAGQGKLREAEVCYRRALDIKPDYAQAHYNLGQALADRGAHEAAAENHRRALACAPDFAAAQGALGTALAELGRPEEAEACFRRALTLDPDAAPTHANLGELLSRMGRAEDAIDCYRRVVALDPGDAAARHNLGDLLAARGQLQEAVDAYRQALERDPKFTASQINMGNALADLGRGGEAIAAYQRALEIEPRNADAYHNLSLVHVAAGRREAAEEAARAAVRHDPNFVQAQTNLGGLLNQRGRVEEAALCYRRALGIEPENAAASHLLAALEGRTTPGAPRDYIEELFDLYATRFEDSLVGQLDYRQPEIFRDALAPFLAEGGKRVLDLGCGTGLVGLALGDLAARLTGVDLSRKMIAEAGRKNIYDRLEAADLTEFMAASDERYDLIVAADVFVYIGDLAPTLQAAARVAEPDALMFFCTEHGEGAENGFAINGFGRYAHTQAYVERVAKNAGFTLVERADTTIRTQNDDPVAGDLYLLRRTAA